MSAYFIKAAHHRKPHVISRGMVSMVSTLYETACGQVVRYRSDFDDVVLSKPGEVKADDVCGICRRKTTQEIAA